MKAVIYVRVSDQEQVDGYSLDAQLRACRDFVEAKGWTVYREYVDEGVSARTNNLAKRPLFQEATADAVTRRADVMVVPKLDRFARNVRVTLELFEKLQDAGAAFVSVSEQIDFSTAIGKVILTILAAFSQYFSDNLSSEVGKGLKERAMQGLWNGPVPFGYEAVDGKLAAVNDEADLVSRSYEMYASGIHTYRTVSTWLNQTEFRPRHGKGRKDREYLWTSASVKGILRNETYLGYVKYKGQLIPGQHSPIVTQELFDKVQEVRKEHFIGPSTFSPRYRTYLLKGLLRCVHCGEKLWSKNITGHDYYQETSSVRGISCPNGKGYVRSEIADDQVSSIIASLTLPPSWREMVIELLSSKDDAAEVNRERVRLEEKLRRLRRLYQEVEIEESEYRREVSPTEARLSSLVDIRQDELVTLGDNVEGVVVAWNLASEEERHDMLQMMLDAVYIDMTTKQVVGIRPKTAFLPLFNLKEPIKTGEFALVTDLTAGEVDSPPSPNTHILLPSGITVFGVEDWVTKLANVA